MRTLTITKEIVDAKIQVTVLHLNGALDAQSEEILLAHARDAYDAGARYIVLDLAEVTVLSSAGMRAMQKVYKMFTPKADMYKIFYVKLCRAPQDLYQTLDITGFLQNIQGYKTLQDAIESFENKLS
jgi:anti-anti-sigma factor